MKKLYFLLLLIILPEISFGSHAMGAEISYSCLGNNQYQVYYTLYRDCVGILAPAFIDLHVGTSTTAVSLTPLPNMPIPLSTTCATQPTTCNGGTYLGIEKWVYGGIITVSPGSTIIYHSESARNSALTTIVGAGYDNLFVYAEIINTNGDCNESPIFYAEPVVILCQGTGYCFPPFVFDPDEDSLTFELITPRTGPLPADTVEYLTGYSTQHPLSTFQPITINPATGELCIVPSIALEVTPIAMLVSEFRNGVLIGQVERDMQIRVEVCNNNLPAITGFNGLPSTVLNVCANQQNCFFITGVDADVSNATVLFWDLPLQNSTETHATGGGMRDTLFICWTPSDSDTIHQQCINITINDNNCPIPGIISRTLCLNVIPSTTCNPNGIDEVSQNSFTLFPQPTSNELNFLFEAIQQKQLLVIYPVSGKEVGRYEINEKQLTIDTSTLPGGIYIAAVTDEFGSVKYSKRLIILK